MKTFLSATPYPYKHWLSSLCLAPLLPTLESIFIHHDRPGASAEVYIGFVALGLVFSLPTFLLYHLLFNVLLKRVSSTLIIKLILNVFAVCGVLITIKLIYGTATEGIGIIYSATLVLTSFFFRIKREVYREDTASIE